LILILAGTTILSAERSLASTACTFISTAEEMPIPMDERESDRTVRTRFLTSLIERGDKQANKGRLARAAKYYLDVFKPFRNNGFSYGPDRCAEPRLYQQAADKLRAVAIPYAKKLMAEGYYETARKYDKLQGGALYLLLYSNSYDLFIEHSFAYAVSDLPERDVDTYLQGLIDWRLQWLKQVADTSVWDQLRMVDDTAPLLDEEQAAFTRLADFSKHLRAHLKPLYPKITDHWLAEEARLHRDLVTEEGFLINMQLMSLAPGAISSGLNRLRKHPGEVKRLRSRGNVRGEAFMSQQKYDLARAYFKVTGNEERWTLADEQARHNEQARIQEIKSATEAYVVKMKENQKTDAEKAAFEEEADAMAEEFGFDLDD
jgi:hypothetical protein